MTSVNRERVQLLVDALESDEFGQCKGALRMEQNSKYTYCCLGVATEVALRNGLPETVTESRDYRTYDNQPASVWNHSGGQLMSYEVMDWYGFTERSPKLKGPFTFFSDEEPVIREHLAHHWNDSYDADFRKIAAMFREKYLAPETAPTD